MYHQSSHRFTKANYILQVVQDGMIRKTWDGKRGWTIGKCSKGTWGLQSSTIQPTLTWPCNTSNFI